MPRPEQLPPSALEAEKGVIGAILLNPDVLLSVLEIIPPGRANGYFYQPAHAKIYDAMVTLMERHEPIDMALITDILHRRGELEKIGGSTYLADLMESVVTSANVIHHARLVRDKALLRDVINLGSTLTADGFEERDLADIVDGAQQTLMGLTNLQSGPAFSDMQSLMSVAIHAAEEGTGAQVTGVTTGFYHLDSITSGLQPSDMIIIAARPGMGKTALALQLGVNACALSADPKPVAMFSLEMSKEQLAIRLLCSMARFDSQIFRRGNLVADQWGGLMQAAEHLGQLPLLIDDTPRLSVLDIRARTKRLQMERGLGLIIIDYLQLLNSHRRSDSRQQEISEISRDLKIMAKEMNVPVIALSQLNRDVEKRGRTTPQLSDLRDSGSLEQDADIVMFIYRDIKQPGDPETAAEAPPVDDRVAKIIVAKQRNGPTGEVKLAFHKEYARFDNLDTHHQF